MSLRPPLWRWSWLLLFVAAEGRGAWAAATLPDWVVQASAVKTSSYAADITAVILLDDRLITIGPDGRAVERERRVLRVLRQQGREFSNLMADYSKDSKVDSFHAWSITHDGRPYFVRDQEFHDEAIGEWGILYDDLRARTAHPPVDVGGIVAYEIVRHQANYGDNEQTWEFQQNLPFVRAVFELDLPPQWQHTAAWLHHAPVNATEVVPGHWRWELSEVPPIDVTEIPMTPSPYALAGRMVVHYAAGPVADGDRQWAQVGNFYSGLASSRTEAPSEIAAKAREVGAGQDFKTRVRGIAGFMQTQIRYVGIEIGIGGMQPHAAADVFHYRYGDCKDKVTLMIAMLDAVGIRSTWVLVDTRRGIVDPAAPSLRGNHAILAIELPANFSDADFVAVAAARTGKRYLIFDPTDSYTPVGLLPPYLQGGYGILVAGDDSQVILLPVLPPQASTTSRVSSFTLDSTGALTGSVAETRSGEAAKTYRRLYTAEGDKEQHEALEKRLQRDFSDFSITSSNARNAAQMDKNFELEYALSANAYAQNAGGLLLVRPRVVGRLARYYEEKPRTYPIDLGQTGIWRDQVEIKLPPGYSVDDLPAGADFDAGFAHYHSEYKVQGDLLQYQREFIVREIELPADRSSKVEDLMRVINGDEKGTAVLKAAAR